MVWLTDLGEGGVDRRLSGAVRSGDGGAGGSAGRGLRSRCRGRLWGCLRPGFLAGFLATSGGLDLPVQLGDLVRLFGDLGFDLRTHSGQAFFGGLRF